MQGAPTQPRVFELTLNEDYTACFNAALSQAGVDVRRAEWEGAWLRSNVQRGDVVHFHWPHVLYCVPGSSIATLRYVLRFTGLLLALRLRGARIVWTAHNLYPHDAGRTPLHRLARLALVRMASRVCVHGQAAVAAVSREFGLDRDKLVLIEHGNWVDFYPNTISRQEARERLKVPQDAFLYLFLGLCRPYKNLEQLVRSHAALGDDSLLRIVGRFPSDDYRAQVQNTVVRVHASRTRIEDRFVDPDDLQLFLNACDVVALPYRDILTSGAAMLALSFGRPVVAPARGGLPEVITQECGVLYDPNSDTGLTEALRAVRARRFDPGAIIRRAQQFSWTRSARAFTDAILEPAHSEHVRGLMGRGPG